MRKDNGRYEFYRYFKRDWDPNTKIVKQVYKDLRNNVKQEIKDIFYTNEIRGINSGVSRDMQDFLRTRRLFNR